MGFSGPSHTISNSCTSGIDALSIAITLLNKGLIRAIIIGVDDPVYLTLLGLPAKMSFLSRGISELSGIPFDNASSGMILFKACPGILVEKTNREDSARIVGINSLNDAYDLYSLERTGTRLKQVMQSVLTSYLDVISSPALGIPAADAMEASAIRAYLNGLSVPIFSIKSSTGHSFGSSTILQNLVSIRNASISRNITNDKNTVRAPRIGFPNKNLI